MPIYTVIGTATYFTNSGPTPPPVINSYKYGTGLNASGQLGLGNTADRSSPSLISSGVSWLMFSSDYNSTAGIRSDNSLWTWGYNNYGQLGSGTTVDRSSPVRVGADTWLRVAMGYQLAFGIKADYTLWAWGDNSIGQFGLATSDRVSRSSPVQVGVTKWQEITTGGGSLNNYVFAQKSGLGLVYAWGSNTNGELGLGDRVTRSSPTQITAVQLVSLPQLGKQGTASITGRANATSYLWAWGVNSSGQLGLGDTVNRSTPTQISGVDTWARTTTTNTNGFGIKGDQTLWGWGLNTLGQIGAPQITTTIYTWSSVASMGGPRGAGAPSYHVLRSDGTIWAWGYNNYGQLGVGDTLNRSSPTQVGSATNWTKLYQPQPAGIGGAINSLGQLFVWGDNRDGGLGQQDVISRSAPIQIPGSWTQFCGSMGLKTGNTLWTWGIFNLDATNGILGSGDGNTVRRSSPYQVGTSTYSYINSSGAYNTTTFFVINSIGKLYAWGRNQQGQIGDGTTVGKSSMVAILSTSSFTQISARDYTAALAITTTGKLYAWGVDTLGQLGLTVRTTARSTPLQVGASSWTFITTGSTTMGVKLDGTLWAWGSDAAGEYGNDVRIAGLFRSSPVQVQAGTTWTTLGGFAYSGVNVGVTTVPIIGIKGGELYQWGYGGGYLSPYENGSRSSPVQVPTVSSVVSTYSYTSSPIQIGTDSQWAYLYGGADHVLAVDVNGGLYGWGSNEYGQLGTGDTVRRSSPVQIASALQESGIFVGYDVIAGAYDTFYSKPTA